MGNSNQFSKLGYSPKVTPLKFVDAGEEAWFLADYLLPGPLFQLLLAAALSYSGNSFYFRISVSPVFLIIIPLLKNITS